MKTLIWLTFALLSVAWTALAALTVKASDWLLGTVASAQAGEALGNAVMQPLPESLEPWISPVWLAAPREFLLEALQMAEQFVPSPDGVMAWIAPLIWTGWALGAAALLAVALGLHWLAGRLQPAMARFEFRS